MMRFIYFSLLFFCSFITATAQDTPPEFGKVSLLNLIKKSCASDSTMEAEIIYDIGESRFQYYDHFGFKLVFERKTRIKIFTKAGTQRADISIPYYIKDNYLSEQVTDIEGYTYNVENGVIAKTGITKKDVYDVKVNENWSKKTFALPKVQEGSIIEFKYKVISPFWVNLQNWVFQEDIPVQWSEYKVTIPGFFSYQTLKQGYLTFHEEESKISSHSETVGPYTYKSGIHHWVLKDVPPFREEKYMTTPNDYIAKIEFQLREVNIPGRHVGNYVSSWEELIKEMLKDSDFGRNYGKITSDIKEIVQTLIAGKNTDFEKAVAIYEYVQQTFTWNGDYRRQPEKSVKNLLEDKSGNSTDLNLLLANMLQQAGIQETPVLTSTRSNGKVVKDYPFLHKFDNTLVYVVLGENQYLLDATDPYLAFGLIARECLNGDGLIADGKDPRWINLEGNGVYYLDTRVMLRFDEAAEKLKAQYIIKYDGYASLEKRKNLMTKTHNDYESDSASGTSAAAATITDIKIKNMETYDQPLFISYNKLKEADQGSGSGMIYLNPILSDRVTENPFKSPQRLYPVDYGYKQVYLYTASFVIPPGYEIEELPEPATLQLQDNLVLFKYIVNQTAATVQITSQIVIKEALIGPQYYEDLKNIYDQIVKKHAELFVLRKI